MLADMNLAARLRRAQRPSHDFPTLAGMDAVRIFRWFSDDPVQAADRIHREYGDKLAIHLPGRSAYFLFDPEIVEEVLVRKARHFHKDRMSQKLRTFVGNGILTSEGEEWRKHRKMAAPPLARKHIRGYAEQMVDSAKKFVASVDGEKTIEMHEEMMYLALDIVSRTLFDATVEGDGERIGEVIEACLDHFARYAQSVWRLLPYWVPSPGYFSAREASASLDSVLQKLIAEKRAAGLKGDDILTRLLLARYEDGTPMSDAQLRDEAVTIFVAGHETTGLTLTYAMHLLVRHPQVLARALEEIDQVLGDRDAGFEDVRALTFIDAVAKEVLRMYPPAWAMGREAIEDVEIGGYTFEKGSQLIFSQKVMHNNAEWFANPEQFLPDRWLDGSLDGNPRFAYFPFGGGPRVCIGNHFAQMEIVLSLATLLQHLEFDAVVKRPIRVRPAVTLRPDEPVMMRVRPRQKRGESQGD